MIKIPSYVAATIDIASGLGSDPKNKPNNISEDPSLRHASAWEQTKDAVYSLARAIDAVDGFSMAGVSSADTNAARASIDAAIMPKNRGE